MRLSFLMWGIAVFFAHIAFAQGPCDPNAQTPPCFIAGPGPAGGSAAAVVQPHGTWSFTKVTTGVTLNSSGSTYTILAPAAAGHLLILSLQFVSSGSDTATSIGGTACSVTWVRAARSVNANAFRSQEVWYCTASTTSAAVVVNYTASADSVSAWMFEASDTLGVFFDTAAESSDMTCNPPTCAGPSIGTAGANDLLFTYYTTNNTDPVVVGPPWTISGTLDPHGNPYAYSLNQPTGIYAPLWTVGATDNSVSNSVLAFRETSAPILTSDVHYIANLGNSNITNYLNIPAISTTQPCANTMLAAGLFTPLLTSVAAGGEGPQPGEGNQLSVLATGSLAACFGYIANLDVQVFIGGAYTDLAPGTTTYNAAVADITTAKTAATSLGKTMTVDAFVYGAGGTDFTNSVPAATYTTDMLTLQSSFQTAANAVTGQSGTLPMLMYMNSKWTEGPTGASATPTYAGGLPGIQFGVWNAWLNNQTLFALPGPSYQYTYQPSGTSVDHTDAPSNLTMGQKIGEVVKRITVDKQPWVPLMYRSVSISGTTVTFRMWVPYLPVVIDTTLVPNWSNTVSSTCRFYGFEFFDNSGAPPCFTSATVTAPDTITLTLASVPTGSAGSFRLRYDYTGQVNTIQGTQNAPGGNVHDSDPTVPELAGGYPLYNWLMGPMDIAIPSTFTPGP